MVFSCTRKSTPLYFFSPCLISTCTSDYAAVASQRYPNNWMCGCSSFVAALETVWGVDWVNLGPWLVHFGPGGGKFLSLSYILAYVLILSTAPPIVQERLNRLERENVEDDIARVESKMGEMTDGHE